MSQSKVRVGIDPFTLESDWSTIASILSALKPETVVPTFLLGYNHTHWICNSVPSDNGNVHQIALERLKEISNEVGWAEPEIVDVKSYSHREDIEALANFLDEDPCDFFVAKTHNQKGLSEKILGSFSENLLLRMKKPLLFVSPDGLVSKSLNNVLFPTDFSSESKIIFEKLLKDAPLGIKPTIHLYSKTINYAYSSYSVVATPELGLLSNLEQQESEAPKWTELGESLGYSVDCHIDQDTNEGLEQSILGHAERLQSDMIVLGSHVGDTEVLFTGSHSRRLVRKSALPVFVWHG